MFDSDLPSDILARRARNDLLPISRLPIELLCIVLSLVLSGETNDTTHGYSWISLFHVCYRWYIVGTSYPALWTSLGRLRRKECMQEMLRRSCGLPLQARAKLVMRGSLPEEIYQPTWKAEAANELLKELPRIKSLSLVYAPKFWEPTFPSESLPILEKLNLKVLYKANPTNPMEPLTFDVSAASPFHADIPNLRELGLNVDCNIRGILRFPNLVSLQLAISPYNDAQPYSYNVRDLIESLRGMPSLEVLRCTRTFGDLTSTDDLDGHTAPCSPVHLPNLKAIWTVDLGRGVGHLLDRVVVPVKASIFVAASFYVQDELDIPHFVATLGTQFTRTLPNGTREQRLIRNLTIAATTVGDDHSISSVSFSGCAHPRCCGPLSNGCHDFDIRLFYMGGDDWVQLVGFSEMLQALPLDRVRTLKITGPEAWNSLLAHIGQMKWEDVRKVSAAHRDQVVPPQPSFVHAPKIREVFPKLKTFDVDIGGDACA